MFIALFFFLLGIAISYMYKKRRMCSAPPSPPPLLPHIDYIRVNHQFYVLTFKSCVAASRAHASIACLLDDDDVTGLTANVQYLTRAVLFTGNCNTVGNDDVTSR